MDQPPAACEEAPLPAPKLEISFGNSLLFVDQPLLTTPNAWDTRVVPVGSLLLLGEWLATPRFAGALTVNVPLGTVKKINEDGEIYETHSAAMVAVGPRVQNLGWEVTDYARLNVQLGAFVGRTVNRTEGNATFPMGALRLHLVTPEGTAMYLGAAYAFSEETLGLIYGVGTQF